MVGEEEVMLVHLLMLPDYHRESHVESAKLGQGKELQLSLVFSATYCSMTRLHVPRELFLMETDPSHVAHVTQLSSCREEEGRF
jgi:hypothetical protein